MIAALACCLAVKSFQQQGVVFGRADLVVPASSPARMWIQANRDADDPPHLSPKKFGELKQQWAFPWYVGGFGQVTGESEVDFRRFRVYSQEQKGNPAFAVTEMLLRLWEFNLERLKLRHHPNYRGLVDVYLCYGGKAGGEQILDTALEPIPSAPDHTKPYNVNTIYIYDMGSFSDPVEMAREVAHEYGHATWPHFGGFKEPEEWAEGYLSEKVYLQWIRDGLSRGDLAPSDTMGATKAGLDKWIAANVDPLVLKAAQVLPTPELIADPVAGGMNEFLGLALYVERLFPTSVFERSLKLTTAFVGKDYPTGVILAAQEPERVKLKIPADWAGKAIWVPLGAGRIRGAPILKKAPSGWAQIRVGVNPIIIDNPR